MSIVLTVEREWTVVMMSDYITKEEVLNLLTPSDTRISDSYIGLAKEEIKLRPSVDVVEVVRCKDCKKRNTRMCMMNNIVGMNKDLFDDDYCSYGEKGREHEDIR